jgi:ADP-sugar diphosphatase
LGAEIEELNTAIGISFKKSDLINLTQMAYEQSAIYNASGLCPSIGNCSEFIELCYVRKEITRRQLNKMRQRFSEMREGGDTMTLRVVPLEDIWKVSADMKVVW